LADRRRFRARLAMSASALPRRALAAFGALFLAAILSGFALGAADGSAAEPLPAGYPNALVEAAGARERERSTTAVPRRGSDGCHSEPKSG